MGRPDEREWSPGQRFLEDEVMTHEGRRYNCSLSGITGTWPPMVINGKVASGSAVFTPLDPL